MAKPQKARSSAKSMRDFGILFSMEYKLNTVCNMGLDYIIGYVKITLWSR